ncbi:MAG: phosphoribosylglycinamide formyltransferase, partial [Hyphomicrobiales bacterium]|nr:phosphoribosylglycinamide formyltransferase [Hyphomicrobiales bacterium]
GSNMQALVEAARAPDCPFMIALVLSNRPDAAGLDFSRRAGVATEVVDHKAFASREAFDAALDVALDAHGVDLVALAGFMRVLSAGFVERRAGRMINVHPSLLPQFRGLHTHRRALEAGVAEHGCTVHWVTPGLDEGAPIAQARVPVLPGDTEETLAARVLAQEHRLYPQALASVAQNLHAR